MESPSTRSGSCQTGDSNPELDDARFEAARSSISGDLATFLAIHAPSLLSHLNPDSSLSDNIKILRSSIATIGQSGNFGFESEVWPSVTSGSFIEKEQSRLNTLIDAFEQMHLEKKGITSELKRSMLESMLLTRALDNQLSEWFQNKGKSEGLVWQAPNGVHYPSPQKGFRSLGQEGVVGVAAAVSGRELRDRVGVMIRELGVALHLGQDPREVLAAQAGKDFGPMGGRDLHIGNLAHGILPPTAPLAISIGTLAGSALAFKLIDAPLVAIAFIGEGGSSLGEWHEAMRIAAATKAPLVSIVSKNQWALGTHNSEAAPLDKYSDSAAAYGIPGITIYGNDPEEVFAATRWATERARAGNGPTLIELSTYRRCGHAHHDEVRFAAADSPSSGYEYLSERNAWESADPIETYAANLISDSIISVEEFSQMRDQAVATIHEAAGEVEKMPWPRPTTQCDRVLVPRPRYSRTDQASPDKSSTSDLTYDGSIRATLVQSLESDPNVYLIGEDIGGRYGGAFGITQAAASKFPNRVINMPIAEGGIINAAAGMALEGLKVIAEIQFDAFLASGWNALTNNLAKLHYRYFDYPLHVVIRLPYGAATKDREVMLGGGPFHSQCPEGAILSYPGLNIVAPSDPYDAKGILNALIRDGNPGIFLEHKGLYSFFSRDWKEPVPSDPNFEIPLGRAVVRRTGSDMTIVTYGAMRWTAEQAAEKLAQEGISCEVVDLRSLVPLDKETVLNSIRKTGALLMLEEGSKSGGVGRNIISLACTDYQTLYSLNMPVEHVAAPDQPVPYSPPLEYSHLPNVEDVLRSARRLYAEGKSQI